MLYALMDAVVDRDFPILQAFKAKLEDTEERIFAGSSPRGLTPEDLLGRVFSQFCIGK